LKHKPNILYIPSFSKIIAIPSPSQAHFDISDLRRNLSQLNIQFYPGGEAHLTIHTPNSLYTITINQNGVADIHTDEKFCVGSVSKFVMGLVIEGVLQKHGIGKHTPLGDIFDDAFFKTFFEDADREKAKGITPEMGGRHLSGIVPGNLPADSEHSSDSITQSCQDLGIRFRFLSDPGDGVQIYSNIAVNLLGMIVEKLENTGFRSLVSTFFERNMLDGLEFKNPNACADVAIGLWATPDGLSKLLVFLANQMSKEDSNDTGFSLSQIQDQLDAVQTEGVRRGWLFESPYKGVWGHGGNIGLSGEFYRSHFFAHPETETGFCMVSKGIVETKDWDVIRSMLKDCLGWENYQGLSPKFPFEDGESDSLSVNTVCVGAGAILVRRDDGWYSGTRKLDPKEPAQLKVTKSGHQYVKFEGQFLRVTPLFLSTTLSDQLAKIDSKTFSTEVLGETITISFSVNENKLTATIQFKLEERVVACLPNNDEFILAGFPYAPPQLLCRFDPQANRLTLYETVDGLLYADLRSRPCYVLFSQ